MAPDKTFFSLATQVFLIKNPPPPFDSPKKGWVDMTREEVDRVRREIATRVRSDYANLVKEYQIAYPGYDGYLDYYGRLLTEESDTEPGTKKSVLCYGVGSGHDFGTGAMENPKAVGIELSGEMIRALKKIHPNIKQHQIIEADVLDMFTLKKHLEEESFDTVLAPYSFLQYITRDQMQQLMENTYAWLKPGGRFHADIFNAYLIPPAQADRLSAVRKLIRFALSWITRAAADDVSGEKKDRKVAVNLDARAERVTITAYVIYQLIAQTMQEYTVIKRPAKGTEVVLGMDYNFHYPSDITEPLKDAGFVDIEVRGGYKGEPFNEEEEKKKEKKDMQEVNVFFALKPEA